MFIFIYLLTSRKYCFGHERTIKESRIVRHDYTDTKREKEKKMKDKGKSDNQNVT